MPPVAAAAVGLALALDLLVAEVPRRAHPVALFGRLVGIIDRRWRRPSLVGGLAAVVLPLAAAGLCGGLTAAATEASAVAGGAVAGLVLFSTTSLRMLHSTARDVVEGSATDVDTARSVAVALVGRDTASLSPGELRSAAVESAAENLADGLVGPLLAFVLGAQVGLPAAAGAAAWVKAVNTMDSMLGYESTPVGWASARLDDAVMWLPARLSAGVLALVTLDPGAPWRARVDARSPASPNSGWPMATLAMALDVRLTKPGAYVLNEAGPLPDVETATRGVRLVGAAGLLAFAAAGVLAWS